MAERSPAARRAAERDRGSGRERFFAPAVVLEHELEQLADGAGHLHRVSRQFLRTIQFAGCRNLPDKLVSRAPAQYGGREDFNLELQQPIKEARYNQLWLQVEMKKGRNPFQVITTPDWSTGH
jgi:hypothetical protein